MAKIIYNNLKAFKLHLDAAIISLNHLKENKDIMIIKENLNFFLILKGNTFYYVNLEYLISLKRIFTANWNNDKKEILDIIFELSPDCIKLKLYSNIGGLGIDNKIEEKWFIYYDSLINKMMADVKAYEYMLFSLYKKIWKRLIIV